MEKNNASRMLTSVLLEQKGQRGGWEGWEWGRHFLKWHCNILWAHSVTERCILYRYGIMVDWCWHGRETCPIVMLSSTNPTHTGVVNNCLSHGTVRMRMKKEKLVSVCCSNVLSDRAWLLASKRVCNLWHVFVFLWWRSCVCGTVPCYRPILSSLADEWMNSE